MPAHSKINLDDFMTTRKEVLSSWPTGKEVRNFESNVKYQEKISDHKHFGKVLMKAEASKGILLQPRSGAVLVDENIKLLRFLENEADVLTMTIDSHTRQNKYDDAQKEIERSMKTGESLLSGFPAVNHGVEACRKISEAISKPLQVRHVSIDARLLCEMTIAGGVTAFEGGGVSCNLPYVKNVSPEKSLDYWQYVDRMIGLYEEHGISINREPFGPLSKTLVPPFISHTVALLEGLLALEQGVKSLSLGYGQLGNWIQDIAAIRSLKELAHEYFKKFGHSDYQLTTVFHQWMGGFPDNEAKAFSVISWGGALATFSGATKVIVKTPYEAMGIPTKEANLQGLQATRQMVNMLSGQPIPESALLNEEVELIKSEVRFLMNEVLSLVPESIKESVVQAIKKGIIDIPFATSSFNKGKLLPIRDNEGCIRIFNFGFVPMSDDLRDFHRRKISKRAEYEGRTANFQMVIDDIYAISKGSLVGRPPSIS